MKGNLAIAMESLYRTHAEAVFRYAFRLVGNRELAEDITGEAFLEFYRNQESVQAERLPAWLFTVVKNRAVDYWRKCNSERNYLGSLKEPATSPEAEFVQGQVIYVNGGANLSA